MSIQYQFTPEQRRALTDAGDALRTIVRLEQFKLGGTLTSNQTADYDSAVRSYNETRTAVPEISTLESDFSDIDLDRSVRQVTQLAALAKMDADSRHHAANLRSFGLGGSEDGLGSTRAADPIRDMIESNTRWADFDMPSSAELRAIPAFGGDLGNTRAIADFSDQNSLFTKDFGTQVAVYMRTLSPWVNLATIDQRDEARPTVYPTLTADPTTYTPGEGTATTESTPTLGTVTATPVSYRALAQLSWESVEDNAVNLTSLVARQQARSIGLSFGSAATTAILAAVNNGGTATGAGGLGTAVSTFFGWEDLITLKYGRAAPYRDNGVFIASNGAVQKIAKFRDQQGEYFFQAGNGPGATDAILGARIYEDPNLATPASATKSAIYGDASAGLVIRCSPMRVAQSSDFAFDKDLIFIKTVWRAALGVVDPAALAYLVSANT